VTCAFGLGIDCPDVCREGSELGTTKYIRGLSPREWLSWVEWNSIRIDFVYENTGQNVSKEMKEYGENTVMCRWLLLFKDFLFSNVDISIVNTTDCCDLCAVRQ